MAEYTERQYYQHETNCSKNNFTPLNENELKTCLDCAGVFDKDGKGVAVTSYKFDRILSEEEKLERAKANARSTKRKEKRTKAKFKKLRSK